MSINKANKKLPSYLDFIYGDLYKNPSACKKADSFWNCHLRTLFQYNTLVRALLKEIKLNNQVIQFGITFGNQIEETALTIGVNSQYDIIDICGSEINRVNQKYKRSFPKMLLHHQDARTVKSEYLYDVAICFMVLSQIPPASKRSMINNALKMVKPGGKVIFIDWHKPLYYHPLRYVVRMYNRLNHPFAERLWDRDINSYADTELRSMFSWRKTTYFGRMFQKCVAIRKEDPSKSLPPAFDDTPVEFI